MVSQEKTFEWKKVLQQNIEQYEKRLQETVQKQATATKIEELAQLILEYEDIQNHIGDRAHVFALLSEPMEAVRRPMVKSQFFSYIEAAETVGIELVDYLTDWFLEQIRIDIQAGEDDAVDLIQNEYKEYILPGKIIAERFDQIDMLIDEMNRYCRAVDADYDEQLANDVLEYAFRISVHADTKMEPTIHAVRELQFSALTPESRASLLDAITEHLSILRFEEGKKQQIAMDKAVEMIEQREEKKEEKK